MKNSGIRLPLTRRKICEVKGRGTVSVRTAQFWLKIFNEGDMSLEHHEIPGPLFIVDDSGAILNAIEMNPSTTNTSRLSDKFGNCQTSVIWILHAHRKVNKCCREVPHELTEHQGLDPVKHVKKCWKIRVMTISLAEL